MCRDPRFHICCRSNLVPTSDFCHTILPVGAAVTGLITSSIGKARFIGHPGIFVTIKSIIRPPTCVAVIATRGCNTIKQVGFRKIYIQARVAALYAKSPFYSCCCAKCHAGAAPTLIANRGDIVIAAHIAQIIRGGVSLDLSFRPRCCLACQLCFADLFPLQHRWLFRWRGCS